ncbi:MAG: PD-(D/E)XK nuclease family protein, partial [Nitrospirae bacterium]|nr:PD-(D/E)XK nuclease family protein [Nitrospirota bacterium]
ADKQGRPLTLEDLSEEVMHAMIAVKFRKEYGPDAVGSLHLLKMQILRHLRDFLKGYQAAMLEQGQIELLELESDLKITWNDFVLKGRLDRVEKRGDRIYIIDYKTQAGDSYLRIRHDRLDPDDRATWYAAIGSLQLPLYLLLLSEARGFPVEQVTPLFLFLGRVRLNKDIESPLFKEGDEILEAFDALKQVIQGLLREIIDPDVPFSPAQDLKAACPLCDFRFICGTQWIVKKR